MSDEYGNSDRRKTKNDKKAKRRFNKYKKGGYLRSMNIQHRSEGNK